VHQAGWWSLVAAALLGVLHDHSSAVCLHALAAEDQLSVQYYYATLVAPSLPGALEQQQTARLQADTGLTLCMLLQLL
jgi:hypothetical protein